MIRCPNCRSKIVTKSASGVQIHSRGSLSFTPDGACTARCNNCRETVTLPLELSKSIDSAPVTFVVEIVRRQS